MDCYSEKTTIKLGLKFYTEIKFNVHLQKFSVKHLSFLIPLSNRPSFLETKSKPPLLSSPLI